MMTFTIFVCYGDIAKSYKAVPDKLSGMFKIPCHVCNEALYVFPSLNPNVSTVNRVCGCNLVAISEGIKQTIASRPG